MSQASDSQASAAARGAGTPTRVYIRFARIRGAAHCRENRSGRGLQPVISNYSWLDGLSFTGMRERYLEVFDAIRIDNLSATAGDLDAFQSTHPVATPALLVSGRSSHCKANPLASRWAPASRCCPRHIGP